MSRDDFEIIYLKYYNVLMIFAYRIVGSNSAAEDIIQDVFTDFWVNKKNVDLSKSIKPYLYKITYNRSLDFLKLSENKNISISNDSLVLENILYSAHTSLDELNYIDIEKEINDCLNKLSERCREVFMLSRHDNLKNKEIAQKLNISIKTVEKHITTALQSLNSHLHQRDLKV